MSIRPPCNLLSFRLMGLQGGHSPGEVPPHPTKRHERRLVEGPHTLHCWEGPRGIIRVGEGLCGSPWGLGSVRWSVSEFVGGGSAWGDVFFVFLVRDLSLTRMGRKGCLKDARSHSTVIDNERKGKYLGKTVQVYRVAGRPGTTRKRIQFFCILKLFNHQSVILSGEGSLRGSPFKFVSSPA